MRFLDIDLTGKKIRLCGNYGDPIYHPDFFNLVDQLKKRGCSVDIETNGSHKTKEWWQQITTVLDASDTIYFSVDGIPENFTIYRVNADWMTIESAMKVCAESSAKTIWKYIPFLYNQDHIDQARQLSQQLGLTEFQLDYSDRFDEQTEHLKPRSELIGARYRQQQGWKQQPSSLDIDPKCNNQQEHFISAEGHYAPCCWVQDHRFYYKTPFGKNKSIYSIAGTTLSEILAQPTTVEFNQNLSQQSCCQYNCPKTL
jgi:hypothetical protein